MIRLAALFIFLASLATAEIPRGAVPLDAPNLPADYRLHVEFSAPAGGIVHLGNDLQIPLNGAFSHDVAIEYPPTGSPVLRVWNGPQLVRGPETIDALAATSTSDFPRATLDFGENFTAAVTFVSTGDGTLFAKCAATGKWAPDAKALFIRGGRLVYDIGWLGAINGGPPVNDGKPHTAVLTLNDRTVTLWLDGKIVTQKPDFTRPDRPGDILKIGHAADNFAGPLTHGRVANLRIWSRALANSDIAQYFKNDGLGANTPDFQHVGAAKPQRPRIEPVAGVTVEAAWVQPLERADHAAIITAWDTESLAKGNEIYNSQCIICHGTQDQPGSLPTALRFGEEPFKNGADPYSMYRTLTDGFGQMVPQPQFTAAQKYAVIQYIRESYLRPSNESQLTEITPGFLQTLPKPYQITEAEKEDDSLPPYERMELGQALFWTLQVEPGNIARKAIAIRLDEGPGGVTKGRAWMTYDHDTMHAATATTGSFVDWKGIAFDGSHGTHTSLTGERHFTNPVGPGWASPTGTWDDPRPLGKDGQPYGPLPREWAEFRGIYTHGSRVVIATCIAGTPVLESPSWIEYGNTPVFTRTLNIAESAHPLQLRVCPDTMNVALVGDGKLRNADGFWVAEFPGNSKAQLLISNTDSTSLGAFAKAVTASLDLSTLTYGGPQQWPQEIVTTSQTDTHDGAFPSDTFPLPADNPWQSWLRPGGFDFTPDGNGAVVAMWNGDIWRVDGLMKPTPSSLTWRRIASGLFQPLGVKFRGDDLFVLCRDQLARLHDLNGDGEIDFIECFNNDHQVTEHFHEFAMGLQTDADGNFYYAKSARHALDSVVPQHGTLMRISADGSHTDIIATGFRAANGVCINDDGTFFVTDQEGHWTPKNRINHVKEGGFYGNMFGYSNVTDTSDAAMEQPMVWITNHKDRSPAELVRIPQKTWGNLAGSLINLSYGTGRAFIVPNEEVAGQWQGAVCELPMPAFETGIMRGRFGPDGALYTCGLFAWAGNATSPGGFHRIRRNEQPAHIPISIHAAKSSIRLTFSDPLDPASVTPAAFKMKIWSLKRSANYGSAHHDERPLEITAASLDSDARTIVLEIPALAPTQSYELTTDLRASNRESVKRSLNGTIHILAE